MSHRKFLSRTILALAIVLAASYPAVAALNVASTVPGLNAGNVDFFTPISVTFDVPVDPTSFTPARFSAFGRFSGAATGPITFSNGNMTVTLTPQRRFQAGEVVTVFLANTLRAADNTTLRAAGYSWQFTTRTRCAGLSFTEIDEFTNRSPANEQTRIYGAVTTDFNEDGWIDIATINEVSADMRLFLNNADGSGLYGNYLTPPVALRDEVSPNESGDFNNDGHADFAVASSNTDTLCIVLGNGNGTFSPAQFLASADRPHGVAVLDYDGDGDQDVCVSCDGGNVINRYTNNGSGVFAANGSFDSTGNGEYALIAADMNEDGILDLVAGCRFSQTAVVLRGNGNGTFTAIATRAIGGEVWVINAADMNGDGNLDIVAANAFSANGAILMGNGLGGLAAAQIYPSTGHTASTDVGDLDGDGDMDWILSAFGGENWRLYRNTGGGNMVLVGDIAAPNNPSCAALFDTDNDGDLDMTLFDEIADVVIISRNNATRHAGDVNLDGVVDLADLSRLLGNFGATSGAVLEDGDVDRDGDVDLSDLAGLLASFGLACA
jgi:FG-GAP-like repeat/Bacterial Ig-like domain